MTLSISRYSHLTLAVTSALFLLMASLSGIILSFEPIVQSVQPFGLGTLEKVTLGQTLSSLESTYDEVLSLEVDADDFVSAAVLTQAGTFEHIYINPLSGEKIGVLQESAPLFTFARNLHRSLFLKSIGRFFVGFVSLLLLLIAFTGLLLLIKRQGGIRRLFSRIEKDTFTLRYHVLLSRWFFIPILVVAATGVFLSAENFSLLPSQSLEHTEAEVANGGDVSTLSSKHLNFDKLPLADVRKVTFPFSKASDDYFEIALKDRELWVDQYSQIIRSEVNYPWVLMASRMSYILHTGQGSIAWSLVLMLTSFALLFFMYSGFAMTFKRRANRVKAPTVFTTDEAEFIILVGSETGSTYPFATALFNALLASKKKVIIAQLNEYTTYQKAEHLIVLTATYGKGDAPTNARQFEEKLQAINPLTQLNYAVVGFGSLNYPDYCQYAIKLDTLLKQQANFKAIQPLYKINNSSWHAFQDWTRMWSEQTGISISLKQNQSTIKQTDTFTVLKKTGVNADATFLIHLKPPKNCSFQSGDLLAIQPKGAEKERLYSIGKQGDEIVLSIKQHQKGACSNYLAQLETNDHFTARIQENSHFHFPKSPQQLIFIANGTGIAPFLGMLQENNKNVETHLFWGGRTKESFEHYRTTVEGAIAQKRLTSFNPIYSQATPKKEYVQHRILKKADWIAEVLQKGGSIMICGSLNMQQGVVKALEEIVTAKLNTSLTEFEQKKQIKMDCY